MMSGYFGVRELAPALGIASLLAGSYSPGPGKQRIEES